MIKNMQMHIILTRLQFSWFLCVLCFQRQSFFTFMIQKEARVVKQQSSAYCTRAHGTSIISYLIFILHIFKMFGYTWQMSAFESKLFFCKLNPFSDGKQNNCKSNLYLKCALPAQSDYLSTDFLYSVTALPDTLTDLYMWRVMTFWVLMRCYVIEKNTFKQRSKLRASV